MRELTVTVPAPADLGTEIIGVPEGTNIELDLRFEAVMDGVLVTGAVRGTAVGECVRCLDRLERELNVPFQELFFYSDSRRERVAEAEGEEDDVDFELDGDIADVETVIRDAVVLALPFQPVCREDCPGLCSICGVHLADVPADHHHDVVDPRWAALGQVFDEREEN